MLFLGSQGSLCLVPDVSVLSISEGCAEERERESSNVSCVGRVERGMVPPNVWVNFY